jgi:hypothetical protein
VTPGSSFLATYGAVRFATGKKAPGVIWPLMKAFGLLCYCALLLPVALVELALRGIVILRKTEVAPPIPRFTSGRPRRFADHINDLQEDMKS